MAKYFPTARDSNRASNLTNPFRTLVDISGWNNKMPHSQSVQSPRSLHCLDQSSWHLRGSQYGSHRGPRLRGAEGNAWTFVQGIPISRAVDVMECSQRLAARSSKKPRLDGQPLTKLPHLKFPNSSECWLRLTAAKQRICNPSDTSGKRGPAPKRDALELLT